jgi:hypothetical protein
MNLTRKVDWLVKTGCHYDKSLINSVCRIGALSSWMAVNTKANFKNKRA